MASKPSRKASPAPLTASAKAAPPRKPAATKAPVAKPATPKTAPVTAKPVATTKPTVSKAPAAVKKAAQPPVIKVVNQSATEKVKAPKVKMERDSFTMPKDEYAQIATLKKRLEGLAQPAKKSELLRAGLKLLSALDDAALKAALSAVPTIKTGRPKK